MSFTYKQLFDALMDMYIRDSKFADGGLPVCQFTEKSKCKDLKEHGEKACRKCVMYEVQKQATADLCRKNQRQSAC